MFFSKAKIYLSEQAISAAVIPLPLRSDCEKGRPLSLIAGSFGRKIRRPTSVSPPFFRRWKNRVDRSFSPGSPPLTAIKFTGHW